MKGAWDQTDEANPGVVVGDVDCTVHRGLCSEHGVRGYPTIKHFLTGNKEGVAYRGGRDFAALDAHVKSALA